MFCLDETQKEKLAEWMRLQEEKVAKMQEREDAYYGAIGGGYTYMFTPTGLGVVTIVRNGVTKEEINLTDYDTW
jgi:hypothetical protein